MTSLDQRWLLHCVNRPTAEYVKLVRRGAPQSAVEAGVVSVADIVVEGGRFDFATEGERATRAIVFAVRGDGEATTDPWITPNSVGIAINGDLLDLIAELPDGRVVSHLGAADVLGCVAPQYLTPPSTRVWRLPSSWLRASCEGLVLVDIRQHVRQRVLRALGGPIVAEDTAHAAELRAILAAPPLNLPRVVVANTDQRRAA